MSQEDEISEIKDLMTTGFEHAFIAQVGQLYKIFLSDVVGSDAQKERTKRGLEHAIEAYRLAMKAVYEWEG